MILVDAHQDIAYNALTFGRNYSLPVYKKRRAELHHNWHPIHGPGVVTAGLPDALLGRVALVFATLFVEPAGSALTEGGTPPIYNTPREAYQAATAQWDYYQRLADENDQIRLVTTAADLDAVLSQWQPADPTAPLASLSKRVQGLVLLMENADPILEPKQFEEWYGRGVRIVGPAWGRTRYSGGTGAPGGLTTLGFQLLETMRGFNAMLDLSHMAEQAFYEALERYDGVIIASHSNPRRFKDTDRHLSDEMIRLLAERDGVMGIVPYNRFLHPTWQPGDARDAVPFTRLVDAIDNVCQLTGSAAHVGIGSDFDGGFGLNSIPAGMDTVGDLWWLVNHLTGRGYSPTDVEAIVGGNFLRKLRQVLP